MSKPLCADFDLDLEDLAPSDSDASDTANTSFTRRTFFKTASILSAAVATGLPSLAPAERPNPTAAPPQTLNLTLKVNGESKSLSLDSRTTLLDALREHMD